ncbi:MAG: LamG domain-containing protein [Gammaproteobacteria bacterium]|nr:LamG domain-containing protein [Gammaproteobacteria bacterium]
MAILRHGQRIMQGRTPTQGNQQWIVPKRLSGPLSGRPVFVFDGTTSRILTGISDTDGPGAWEAYGYSAVDTGNTQQLISAGNINSVYRSSATNQISGRRSASWGGVANGSQELELDLWRMEWDGAAGSAAEQRLYKNGELIGTFTVGADATLKDIEIGGVNNFDGRWPGVIANVKIWQTTSDTSTAPEYFWKINEGTGYNIINSGTAGAAGDCFITTGTGYWASWPGLSPI